MSSRPWMPLYVADYLGDTSHLSTLEHGAYLLLIMHYWQHKGLPPGDAQIARVARMSAKSWATVRDTIAAFFSPDWRHKRLDLELAIAEQMAIKRSAAGKAGASVRYGNRMAIARQSDSIVRVRLQSHNSPSLPVQSPTPAKEQEGSTEKKEAAAAPDTILVSSALAARYRK